MLLFNEAQSYFSVIFLCLIIVYGISKHEFTVAKALPTRNSEEANITLI